jgi:hypothetical protein
MQEINAVSTNEKPSADREQKPAPQNQGEGDYESARKYDDDTRDYLKSADVPDLARRAAPATKEEAAELKKAEQVGRSHAIGGQGAESWPQGKKDG